MLDRFRRLSKSKLGTGILAAFGIAILGSFALSDLSGLKNGNFGLGSDTLVKLGGREVTDRDMSQGMQQMLERARQEKPGTTYAELAPEFTPLLNSLVQVQALSAFGDDNGFVLSKRLVDAEIARLPRTQGLDGKFSETAYQTFLAQQRMTDGELRRLIAGSLTQRLLLAPVAANARISTGMTVPYATMLMEQRQGELALVPIAAFTARLNPNEKQIAAFYAANKATYTVPEQRSLRIARFGPADLGAAGTPSEQEIAAYYTANPATYGAKETRVLDQAIVPTEQAAAGIAARVRAGASFADAAKPAGLSAEDVTVGPQTRAQFTALASDKVAAAVFSPGVKDAALVGPIQSDLGWHLIRVESVKGDPGKTLASAHEEIAAKLTTDKRKAALATLVDRIQDGVDGGENFADLVAKNKLAATETPMLTAQGKAPADPAFKLPAELNGALKSGFELTPQDAPVIETLPGDGGFALVALGRQVAAAPAPLDRIHDQVAADWIIREGSSRARAAAAAIAARASAGAPLSEAMKNAGVALPPPHTVTARRIEIDQAPPAVQPAMKMLFTLPAGQARMTAAPGAQGFAIVRTGKIVPGNAVSQPALLARVQSQFQQGASDEYARQFLNGVIAAVGARRNESAIAATRQRITQPASGAE